MATLKPYADNVLIRVDPAPERAGLIYLPETQNRRDNRAVFATVLAVGPGYYPEVKARPGRPEPGGLHKSHRIGASLFVPTEVKPGDRVIVDSIDVGDHLDEVGKGLKGEGDVRMVREAEILAVVEE